jgi:hypothetical protein
MENTDEFKVKKNELSEFLDEMVEKSKDDMYGARHINLKNNEDVRKESFLIDGCLFILEINYNPSAEDIKKFEQI